MKTLLSHIYFKALGAFPYELEKAVHPFTQVLDVGCGTQSPLHYFSDRLEATGADGYAPALEESRKRGIHKNYLNLDLRKIGESVPKNSYDCVVCLDVVEHFEKEPSREFIRTMEGVAKKRVILFTPNGFLPQGALGGNEFQVHRCGWETDELQAMGYNVVGMYGLKNLRGAEASFRIKIPVLGRLISDLTQPYVRNRPQSAFALLAIKNL